MRRKFQGTQKQTSQRFCTVLSFLLKSVLRNALVVGHLLPEQSRISDPTWSWGQRVCLKSTAWLLLEDKLTADSEVTAFLPSLSPRAQTLLKQAQWQLLIKTYSIQALRPGTPLFSSRNISQQASVIYGWRGQCFARILHTLYVLFHCFKTYDLLSKVRTHKF